jgi:hypothetical protein
VPDAPSFEPAAILAVLAKNDVDHGVIGGLAATLHGSDRVTFDVDVTPSTDSANLDRLSAALKDLDARIRVDGIPDGLAFDHDGRNLAGARVWSLTTSHGDLDISFVPDGTTGYDDLRTSAVVFELGGTTTAVASLDDIIRSKEAADRPKDRAALATLRYLRDLQR